MAMNESNPYQAPIASADQSLDPQGSDHVMHELDRSLAQTKPWVTFLSILGFLMTAFVLLAFPLTIFAQPGPGPMRAELGIMFVLLFPMVILFYLVPSVLLWKYSRRIGDYLQLRNPENIASAITAQKSFWRYVGILVAVVIGIYVAGLAIVLVIGRLA